MLFEQLLHHILYHNNKLLVWGNLRNALLSSFLLHIPCRKAVSDEWNTFEIMSKPFQPLKPGFLGLLAPPHGQQNIPLVRLVTIKLCKHGVTYGRQIAGGRESGVEG